MVLEAESPRLNRYIYLARALYYVITWQKSGRTNGLCKRDKHKGYLAS
jgi:hypothetical protein